MGEYTHDIVKGFFSGLFGGVGIFILKAVYDKHLLHRDEKRIVKFFLEENKGTGLNFRSPHAISSFTNLPEDRVNFVCATSKQIVRNEQPKLMWQLK